MHVGGGGGGWIWEFGKGFKNWVSRGEGAWGGRHIDFFFKTHDNE